MRLSSLPFCTPLSLSALSVSQSVAVSQAPKADNPALWFPHRHTLHAPPHARKHTCTHTWAASILSLFTHWPPITANTGTPPLTRKACIKTDRTHLTAQWALQGKPDKPDASISTSQLHSASKGNIQFFNYNQIRIILSLQIFFCERSKSNLFNHIN